MKPSELKPGDHYKIDGHGECIYRYTGPRTCIEVYPGAGDEGPHVGDDDVELVPMPCTKEFPYVVGRAYRTRDGQKRQYMGPSEGFHRFDGRVYDAKNGSNGYFTGAGHSSCSLRSADIMGEWREPELTDNAKGKPEGVELIAGHTYRKRNGKTCVLIRDPAQDGYAALCFPGAPREAFQTNPGMFWYSGHRRGIPGTLDADDGHTLVEDITAAANPTNPKDTTPMPTKRTLPTVTLDQIFNTLRDKDACWYRELGPTKLVKKLDALTTRVPGASEVDGVSLRTLHVAAQSGEISRGDAQWLYAALGTAIRPADYTGYGPGDMTCGAALDEWENPKPKIRPLKDYPRGTTFKHHGNHCKIVGMDYGGDMAGMKTRGLVFMTYGCALRVSFMPGDTPMNDGITDIVEPA